MRFLFCDQHRTYLDLSLVKPLLAELGVEVIPNPPRNPTAHSSVEDLNRRIQTGVQLRFAFWQTDAEFHYQAHSG